MSSVEENGEIISETHVKERTKAHMEEMVIMTEAKVKLAERVKELEEELQQAEQVTRGIHWHTSCVYL